MARSAHVVSSDKEIAPDEPVGHALTQQVDGFVPCMWL